MTLIVTSHNYVAMRSLENKHFSRSSSIKILQNYIVSFWDDCAKAKMLFSNGSDGMKAKLKLRIILSSIVKLSGNRQMKTNQPDE